MKGLLEGLAHMHENRIMHRDLKPANILYFSDEIVPWKLGDLGESTRYESEEGILNYIK